MAKVKWESFLSYKAIELGAENNEVTLKVLSSYVPVSYFGVKGGARRLIDLTSSDDISIASEFEQARKLENLKVYLPPVKDFSSGDLTEIALNKLTLKIFFYANSMIGKTMKENLVLTCGGATITETPNKRMVENKYFLEVKMNIPESAIRHGTRNPKGGLLGFEFEDI